MLSLTTNTKDIRKYAPAAASRMETERRKALSQFDSPAAADLNRTATSGLLHHHTQPDDTFIN